MNRANVIGPSRAISSWMRATRPSSCPTASRSGTGSRRRPGVTSMAPAPASRRRTSRTPGPTSVWPPSRTGIGAAAAEAVSSRSHGSAIRSASSRSEAKRSSARGPAGLLGTDPVGEQHAAVDDRRVREARRDGRRASPARRGRGARRGPSRAAVGTRRGRGRLGQARCRTQAALLDPGPGPRRAVPLEPGQRRRGRPAGDQQLGARVGGDGANACDPRLEERQVDVAALAAGADEDEIERPVDVDREPPAPPQVVDLEARDLLEPARQRVVAGEVRDRRAGSRPARSRRRPPNSGCWRAPVAPRPRRPPRAPGDRSPWRAGSSPSRGRRARPPRSSATSSRRRSPNGRSSGGPPTIATSPAPAARNPRRWCSASVARASATQRVERPGRRIRAPGGGFERRPAASVESSGGGAAGRTSAPRYWARVRTNGPRLHRPGGERRRCGGDADRSGPGARRAPRHAAARRLAPLRDRAGRRHRPARVPQRRGRARRPGRTGPGARLGRAPVRAQDARARVRASGARALGAARARSRPAGLRAWPRQHRTPDRRPDRPMPRSTRRRPPSSSWSRTPRPGARLFVLAPLADLAPRLVPPGWGETVETARRRQERDRGRRTRSARSASWDARRRRWRPGAARPPEPQPR